MDPREGRLLVMRDLMDGQLEASDGMRIGRVDGIVASHDGAGDLALTGLITGPEALTRRLSSRLGPIAGFLFRGHFEHRIPRAEVIGTGPVVKLRGAAAEYPQGGLERWLIRHLWRFIPGTGA